MRDCALRGDAAYASHLLYTQPGVLDDQNPAERQLGIELGLLWGDCAVLTVVYTDFGISNGMKYGIANAEKHKREIETRTLSEDALREANLWEDYVAYKESAANPKS